MLLMGSCLYLYTFRLSNAFIQISTDTNGIGLQTVFIFYLYLTWPAMNTGEDDLFHYLKYIFSFFLNSGNQDFLNELPVYHFFAPQRKLEKLDPTVLQR